MGFIRFAKIILDMFKQEILINKPQCLNCLFYVDDINGCETCNGWRFLINK